MYTDKKNILQLIALFKEHNVRRIVVCPGSRDLPIVQTVVNHPFFSTYQMTDERSGGFFALGMAINSAEAVAIVCTSGSALLNIHPAVAEAFYQQIPLIVVSADRPGAWIGQMDGQTLPQVGVFGSLVKKSVTLPEINTEEDEWFCNRLINEALLETHHHGKGPVHINVPISEPFFSFTTPELPEVRMITRYQGLNVYDRSYDNLIERLNKYSKRMIIAGQMNLIYLFEKKYIKSLYKHFTWLTEHIGNKTVPGLPIKNFDTALYALEEDNLKHLVPELVITYGGHIISKRLKEYLRKNPPIEHWHVSLNGEIADLFGSQTTVIEMDPFEFLERISGMIENKPTDFPRLWENTTRSFEEPIFAYSEMSVIGELLHNLPTPCALHLANSSTVRYAQLFKIAEEVEICSNRGVNGIEGSLSTAIGYSVASDKLNFVVIGDLSFFYDMNALWNNNFGCNLRIMMINNGGGEIFEALPGLKLDAATQRCVAGKHNTSAEGWAKERGFKYMVVNNDDELKKVIPIFTTPTPFAQPMLIEVFTNSSTDVKLLKEYYHGLKKRQNKK